MGRINRSRILFDGCFAHVLSRAADKRYLFRDNRDFEKFKGILLETKNKYAYRIHHYCLMHTHFHLAVSMDSSESFSQGMKVLKRSYARYYNLENQRFGPLWRDRFKSLLIEDERYLQACGSYIEQNPVEAGMVKRCEDWSHSSSRFYAGCSADILVDKYMFPGTPVEVVQDKEVFFNEGLVIGSDLFKIYLEEKEGLPVTD